MIKVSYSMPWGVIWQYSQSSVPRLGEHVSFNDRVYLVVEVRHFPALDAAAVGLRHADGNF